MFSLSVNLCKTYKFLKFPVKGFHKYSNIGKRGKMLNVIVKNDNNTQKNWNMPLMSKPGKKKNIFQNVHKPARRATVLNSLFVRNITDILSTSDIAPEVVGYGIEITQIKITPDYQIVHVFWQVPLSKLDLSVETDIQSILAMRAPKIRAEMISRNVLGRVPKIFFIQDETNSRATEFEKALLSADLGPKSEERIIPDQDFVKNIFTFASAPKQNRKVKDDGMGKKIEVELHVSAERESGKDTSLPPPNPFDMKSDILGLNQETLMTKVLMTKKKSKTDFGSTSTTIQENRDNDLFNQVPGMPLQPDADREKILKQFYIDRKLLMKEKKKHAKLADVDIDHLSHEESNFDYNDLEFESDFFEEENISEEQHF